MSAQARTPAQIYSLAIGLTLLVVGLVGFLVDSSFDAGSNLGGDELIWFRVNGWHNVVHIASGLAGIALSRTPASGRAFALGFGAVYGAVTIWGFIDHSVLDLIPVNTADNWLHLFIAALGIVAGLAPTEAEPRPAEWAR
jgi:hypothetical protein